jgi:hypothetical protein
MMKMKEKSNIEQYERKKNEGKEKSPSHIYDREGKILGGCLIRKEKKKNISAYL